MSRVGDVVHIRWDNRGIVSDGLPVWTAEQGEAALPVAEFLEAVESFHARFLGEMGRRVEDACEAWPRPDVTIKLDQLEREQRERSGWLEPKVRSVERTFSWDEVREAISAVEAALTSEAAEASMPPRGEQV